MLTYRLIHPLLLEALASIGHGSRLLIADGNFPLRTAVNARARVVHLGLAPGVLTVDQVLEVLLDAVNFESGVLMSTDEQSPAQDGFRERLGSGFRFEHTGRSEFYDLVRAEETGLVIATGDQRLFANVLLTIGLS